MKKRRSEFMCDFVVNQFPIDKFKEMIFAYLDLIESFESILSDDNYYIRITPKYELKLGATRMPTSSKIESFIINKYDNKDKMEDCILKFPVAFNNLNKEEQRVFVETFIHNKKDVEINEQLGLHSVLLNTIRKSAIVRFSLVLGFDKYTKYF